MMPQAQEAMQQLVQQKLLEEVRHLSCLAVEQQVNLQLLGARDAQGQETDLVARAQYELLQEELDLTLQQLVRLRGVSLLQDQANNGYASRSLHQVQGLGPAYESLVPQQPHQQPQQPLQQQPQHPQQQQRGGLHGSEGSAGDGGAHYSPGQSAGGRDGGRLDSSTASDWPSGRPATPNINQQQQQQSTPKQQQRKQKKLRRKLKQQQQQQPAVPQQSIITAHPVTAQPIPLEQQLGPPQQSIITTHALPAAPPLPPLPTDLPPPPCPSSDDLSITDTPPPLPPDEFDEEEEEVTMPPILPHLPHPSSHLIRATSDAMPPIAPVLPMHAMPPIPTMPGLMPGMTLDGMPSLAGLSDFTDHMRLDSMGVGLPDFTDHMGLDGLGVGLDGVQDVLPMQPEEFMQWQLSLRAGLGPMMLPGPHDPLMQPAGLPGHPHGQQFPAYPTGTNSSSSQGPPFLMEQRGMMGHTYSDWQGAPHDGMPPPWGYPGAAAPHLMWQGPGGPGGSGMWQEPPLPAQAGDVRRPSGPAVKRTSSAGLGAAPPAPAPAPAASKKLPTRQQLDASMHEYMQKQGSTGPIPDLPRPEAAEGRKRKVIAPPPQPQQQQQPEKVPGQATAAQKAPGGVGSNVLPGAGAVLTPTAVNSTATGRADSQPAAPTQATGTGLVAARKRARVPIPAPPAQPAPAPVLAPSPAHPPAPARPSAPAPAPVTVTPTTTAAGSSGQQGSGVMTHWYRDMLLSQCSCQALVKESSLLANRSNLATLAMSAPYWCVVLRFQHDEEGVVVEQVTRKQLLALEAQGALQVQTLMVGCRAKLKKQPPAELFRPLALLLLALRCGLAYEPVQDSLVPPHDSWCIPPCLLHINRGVSATITTLITPTLSRALDDNNPAVVQARQQRLNNQVLSSCPYWMVLERYDDNRVWRLVNGGCCSRAQAASFIFSGFTPVLGMAQAIAPNSWAPTALFLPIAALAWAAGVRVRGLTGQEVGSINFDNRLVFCKEDTT